MQVLLSLVQDSTVLLWGMVTLVNLIEVANSRGLLSHWDTILDGLEQGSGVDCIYLDFSKAFDKVVLLQQLKDHWENWKVAGCFLGLSSKTASCGSRWRHI